MSAFPSACLRLARRSPGLCSVLAAETSGYMGSLSVLFYLLTSLTLTLMNKLIFSQFQFPLFVTEFQVRAPPARTRRVPVSHNSTRTRARDLARTAHSLDGDAGGVGGDISMDWPALLCAARRIRTVQGARCCSGVVVAAAITARLLPHSLKLCWPHSLPLCWLGWPRIHALKHAQIRTHGTDTNARTRICDDAFVHELLPATVHKP